MPFELLPLSLWRLLGLVPSALTAVDADGRPRLVVRRVLLMLVFLPLFALVQFLHWFFFLLDELFYPGYRRVAVERPLFVLGVPRSGTTFLHRVLARDTRFTTFTTWECLFAPSIVQRKLWLGLAALDRRLGRPLHRLLAWVEGVVFRHLEGVHQVRLDAAEEDYLALLPILRSFILIVPFPGSKEVWRSGRFDTALPEAERRRVMAYYRACLQKHLYVHGPHKTLLSKNAAFAPWTGSLCREFEDARILACLRSPFETLPSQLSAIADGVRLFASNPDGGYYRRQMLDLIPFFYENLLTALPQEAPGRHLFVKMDDLKSHLAREVQTAYERLGIAMTDGFRAVLAEEDALARRYVTSHQYSAASVGLDEAEMRQRLAAVQARLDSAPQTP